MQLALRQSLITETHQRHNSAKSRINTEQTRERFKKHRLLYINTVK
jgi:hypothetical protein